MNAGILTEKKLNICASDIHNALKCKNLTQGNY